MGDHTLFLVVCAGLAACVLLVLYQAAFTINGWLKKRKDAKDAAAFEANIDSGEIPRNYSVLVKAVMATVNAAQVAATEANDLQAADIAAYRFKRIRGLRSVVARVRLHGYDCGYEDKQLGLFQPESSPHPRGSGASQQWVRGYCQGQNIINPKSYIDAA